MKKTQKIATSCLCAALLLSLQAPDMVFSAFAESEEQKVYSNATMEDEFADDSVLVVLNNETSLENLESGEVDFSKYGFKDVRDLTSSRGEQIKTMVDERKNSSLAARVFTNDPNAKEISAYHQVLSVELEERGKTEVLEAISLLEQWEDVLYVCPDYIFTACAETVSSSMPANTRWNPETVIELLGAQNMASNEHMVYVGVLDTGIDADHPWLSGKMAVDGHQDFVTDEPSDACSDLMGHGIHVAGIIAAVAPNVQLISLRVMDSYSQGKSSYLLEALNHVNSLRSRENNPIDIPILNFSGEYKTDDIQEIGDLFDAVLSYGGLFVCGAGNDNVELGVYGSNSKEMRYPASFEFTTNDTMIVVGASNKTDNGLWWEIDEDGEEDGSNFGKYAVDIFAPGESILSCYPSALCSGCNYDDDDSDNDDPDHKAVGYHYMSGTSMATPYVTGVAALVLSIAPDMDAQTIKNLILDPDNVDQVGTGDNALAEKCVSGGRLNARKVLQDVHNRGYHTMSQWEDNGESGHYHVCVGCDYQECENHILSKRIVNRCVFFSCLKCDYYEEQHDPNVEITQNDAQTHLESCSCGGQTTAVAHRGTWVDLNATYHQRTCTDCGYVQLQTHAECWNTLKNMCIACKRTGPISNGSILQLQEEENS